MEDRRGQCRQRKLAQVRRKLGASSFWKAGEESVGSVSSHKCGASLAQGTKLSAYGARKQLFAARNLGASLAQAFWRNVCKYIGGARSRKLGASTAQGAKFFDMGPRKQLFTPRKARRKLGVNVLGSTFPRGTTINMEIAGLARAADGTRGPESHFVRRGS